MNGPAIILDKSVDRLFRDMVLRAFGRGAAKRAAPWFDVTHYGVEGWLRCRREPGVWSLLKAIRHPGFRAELRAYLDHIEMEEANIASQMEELAAERLRGSDRLARSDRAPQRSLTSCSSAQGLGDTDRKRA